MRLAFRAGLVAGLLMTALAVVARADNPVAQAILKLHLSPQQLLSVRDYLGPFSRGIEIEASGSGAFVLRDDATMAYAGGFSLRTGSDGSVIVERVSGAATIDDAHTVTVPLALDRKTRDAVLAALANSQVVAPPRPKEPADVSGVVSVAPASIPPEPLPALRFVNAKEQGTVWQSRAVFFPDGSGYVRSIRAAATSGASPSLKVTDRYFSPIQGDSTKLWRGEIVEVEADLPLGLADLESRYACDGGATCKPPHALTPATGIHVIKWSRQLLASVPPQLLAQIAPPPASTPVAIAPTPPAQASQPAPVPSGQSSENF